jgi:hypothetical protein
LFSLAHVYLFDGTHPVLVCAEQFQLRSYSFRDTANTVMTNPAFHPKVIQCRSQREFSA